jgi:hypothetical protein
MAGLVPAVHAHGPKESRWASCKGGQLRRYVGVDRRGGERIAVATPAWMAGTSPAMTNAGRA